MQTDSPSQKPKTQKPSNTPVKRKPGRPTADAEINIEHLCDVAVNVFAEKGYSGTTTTEITKKAGVARSLSGTKRSSGKHLLSVWLMSSYQSSSSLKRSIRTLTASR